MTPADDMQNFLLYRKWYSTFNRAKKKVCSVMQFKRIRTYHFGEKLNIIKILLSPTVPVFLNLIGVFFCFLFSLIRSYSYTAIIASVEHT